MSMDIAQNILVIKTTSGMANAAAGCSGPYGISGNCGDLAGDDTIACFCKSAEETMALMSKIRKLIHVYE